MNVRMKELLEIAIEAVKELTDVSNPDFRLEQAIYDKESRSWEVVVSWLVKNAQVGPQFIEALLPGFETTRIYKKLTINSDREVTGLYMFDSRA